MNRPKDPQRSLFEASMLLPAEKLERLKSTWAWQFRTRALPLIDEDAFRDLYCPDNGAPNKPVQTVVDRPRRPGPGGSGMGQSEASVRVAFKAHLVNGRAGHKKVRNRLFPG